MESWSLEKENLNKDMRHLFRLKKELNYTSIKDIINLFSPENETKAIKDRILRDIRIFLSMKKKIIVNQILNIKVKVKQKHYVEEYLDKIKPYLKDITTDLKKLTRGKSN